MGMSDHLPLIIFTFGAGLLTLMFGVIGAILGDPLGVVLVAWGLVLGVVALFVAILAIVVAVFMVLE